MTTEYTNPEIIESLHRVKKDINQIYCLCGYTKLNPHNTTAPVDLKDLTEDEKLLSKTLDKICDLMWEAEHIVGVELARRYFKEASE